MKQRILRNWTFRRALYLVIGIAVIIQSFVEHQWFGILFGTYFVAMGLFAFGCAANNCFTGSYTTKAGQVPTDHDVDFEEIKTR